MTTLFLISIGLLIFGATAFAGEPNATATNEGRDAAVDQDQEEEDDAAMGELNDDSPPDDDDNKEPEPIEPAFDKDYDSRRQKLAEEDRIRRSAPAPTYTPPAPTREREEPVEPLVPGMADEDLDPAVRQQLLNQRKLDRELQEQRAFAKRQEERLNAAQMNDRIAQARANMNTALATSLDNLNVFKGGAHKDVRAKVERELKNLIEDNLSQRRALSEAEIAEAVLNNTKEYSGWINAERSSPKTRAKEAEERARQRPTGNRPAGNEQQGSRRVTQIRSGPRLASDPDARKSRQMDREQLREEMRRERVAYQKEKARRR